MEKMLCGQIIPYDDDQRYVSNYNRRVFFQPTKKNDGIFVSWFERMAIPITLSNLIMKTDRTGYTTECRGQKIRHPILFGNRIKRQMAKRFRHTQKPHEATARANIYDGSNIHPETGHSLHSAARRSGCALAPGIQSASVHFAISQIWNIRSNPLIENSIMQWCRTKHKVQQQQQQQQEKHSSAGTLFIFRNMHEEKNKQILCVSFR